jgi:homoserine dehydrogenase
MREIGIGLIGFGTVGAGVVYGLRKNGVLLENRLGVRPVLRGIADIDVERDRGVEVDKSILTTDAEALIRRDDVDLVIELVGGTGVARKFVRTALELGKPVVTANKALLAVHGHEIFGLAAEKHADIYFGASVGGGIPIVRSLREGLLANQVESIYGILNGTCNYILTRMETDRISFDKALREAQQQGYAETDPALDIDGVDTAHKAVILSSLAYGFNVPMSGVSIEGIRGLNAVDLRYALDLGYRIKLLAVIKRSAESDGGSAIEVRVHPTLVPLDHVLASVSGVYNAVMVSCDLAGRTLYYGRGAGREPTASTVLADVADVIRNLVKGSRRRVPPIVNTGAASRVLPIDAIRSRYYLRLGLNDKPGMLGQITSVIGRHGISIASVLQKEAVAGAAAPVVIVTHEAGERDVASAMAEMDSMPGVGKGIVRMRIEE